VQFVEHQVLIGEQALLLLGQECEIGRTVVTHAAATSGGRQTAGRV
jgi:hypothetical protein